RLSPYRPFPFSPSPPLFAAKSQTNRKMNSPLPAHAYFNQDIQILVPLSTIFTRSNFIACFGANRVQVRYDRHDEVVDTPVELLCKLSGLIDFFGEPVLTERHYKSFAYEYGSLLPSPYSGFSNPVQ